MYSIKHTRRIAKRNEPVTLYSNRSTVTLRRLLTVAFLAVSLAACATPGEVEEAVASLDDAYARNSKAMKQYRTLVRQVNERAKYWYLYTTQRALLNTALKWATTTPSVPLGSQPAVMEIADLDATILGPALVDAVNAVRLAGLPGVADQQGNPIFAPGTGDMDNLIATLPKLANLATERAADTFATLSGISDDTYQGFDEYQANVAALRRINGIIKRYLDIDVTVKPDDVKEISSAIKQLQE